MIHSTVHSRTTSSKGLGHWRAMHLVQSAFHADMYFFLSFFSSFFLQSRCLYIHLILWCHASATAWSFVYVSVALLHNVGGEFGSKMKVHMIFRYWSMHLRRSSLKRQQRQCRFGQGEKKKSKTMCVCAWQIGTRRHTTSEETIVSQAVPILYICLNCLCISPTKTFDFQILRINIMVFDIDLARYHLPWLCSFQSIFLSLQNKAYYHWSVIFQILFFILFLYT